MSLFITFEGLPGSGKTIQLNFLAEFLIKDGYQVTVTRSPGGAPLTETPGTISIAKNVCAVTQTLLEFAARRELINDVIAPALKRGEIVLCEGFCDATYAYCGFGHGADLPAIETLEDFVCGTLRPDLTIF